MRNLPDVALVSDNIDMVYGNDSIGESFDFIESGTSLSTPLWAAFMALVNEAVAAPANGQPADLVLPIRRFTPLEKAPIINPAFTTPRAETISTPTARPNTARLPVMTFVPAGERSTARV